MTAGKDPFISSAIYTIDRFDFNGCTIEGPNALVYISDQRPQPTDNLPATIALRGCTWKGTAPHAVTKTKEPPSAKKLILVDEKNTWPKASALIGAECRTPRANRSTG